MKPAKTNPGNSTGPEAEIERVGSFELVLGGILLTAVGFVLDLVTGNLVRFTIGFALIAIAAIAARVWFGYRRSARDQPQRPGSAPE